MPPPWSHRSAWMALVLALLAASAPACNRPPEPADFVARVGEAYLSQQDLLGALETVPARQDSAEVRQQIVEQWVTNELLYQESLRSGLLDDPEVQQRLQESERSVLIDALISRFYFEDRDAFAPAEIRAYYERHKEQLRLREPFVRVRYLSTSTTDDADSARRALQEAMRSAEADSLWPALARRFSQDVEGSLSLAGNYFSENRLFTRLPGLRQQLSRLRPGEIAPVIEAAGQWHLLQVADRVPAGTVPELPWVEEEVRRLLRIDARKQLYERQVQRLRTEAQARDALEIR